MRLEANRHRRPHRISNLEPPRLWRNDSRSGRVHELGKIALERQRSEAEQLGIDRRQHGARWLDERAIRDGQHLNESPINSPHFDPVDRLVSRD
jgi:hypothetical protein